VKLAYILGHRHALAGLARHLNSQHLGALASGQQIMAACLLSGVAFRNTKSKVTYLELMADLGRPIYLLDYNPFVFERFDAALGRVAEALREGFKADSRPSVRRLRDGQPG
jgi:hypothetical protein